MPSASPKTPRVLVTRPQPEAGELARLLQNKGLEPVVAPLFRIVPEEHGELPEASALLLTSPRAARFLPQGAKALPAYVVGTATAEAAAAEGLKVVATGSGEADERLVELLPPQSTVLHLTGEDVARDLGPAFKGRGMFYHRVVIYRAEAETSLPEKAKSFLRAEGEKLVTLLSVRAAEVFAQLVADAGLNDAASGLDAACFGPRIAAAARASLPYRSVRQTEPGNLTQFVDSLSSGGT
ncbi:MAG: uroporphyrinogen-III synthase [Pseudomonadota bacterium]